MSYWVSRCESKKKNCTFWCSNQTIFILRRANVCISYAHFLSIKDTKTAPQTSKIPATTIMLLWCEPTRCNK